jgi:hypothetical protein
MKYKLLKQHTKATNKAMRDAARVAIKQARLDIECWKARKAVCESNEHE